MSHSPSASSEGNGGSAIPGGASEERKRKRERPGHFFGTNAMDSPKNIFFKRYIFTLIITLVHSLVEGVFFFFSKMGNL